MRPISTIFVHCAATPEGRDISTATIRGWHLGQGWSDIGYHKVVELDGSVHAGRPESEVPAAQQGHNTGSLAVCYVGGVAKDGSTPKDTRTPAQHAALLKVVRDWQQQYGVPTSKVYGHYEVANKACPSFDMVTFRAELDGTAPGDESTGEPSDDLPLIGGSNSTEEIKQMQRMVGATADGWIGPETYSAIADYLGR